LTSNTKYRKGPQRTVVEPQNLQEDKTDKTTRGHRRRHYSDSKSASLVPGTAAIRRRRQLMKPQVEVKSMNHRPAGCRRLRSVPPPSSL